LADRTWGKADAVPLVADVLARVALGHGHGPGQLLVEASLASLARGPLDDLVGDAGEVAVHSYREPAPGVEALPVVGRDPERDARDVVLGPDLRSRLPPVAPEAGGADRVVRQRRPGRQRHHGPLLGLGALRGAERQARNATVRTM
jgi:hypothetical protein